jgi:hypothetical protein
MTYTVTEPMNPVFEKNINNRDLGNDEIGDLAPEVIIYVKPENSPNTNGLVTMANEVSSKLSFYTLNATTLSTNKLTDNAEGFRMYPNPSKYNQTIYFNRFVSVSIFDIQGREVISHADIMNIQLPELTSGTCILKTNSGESFKLLIE